jgi:hypothetical protein
MRNTMTRAIARPRAAIVAACLALAAAFPGCGAPEGAGTIDADAVRQAVIARGQPDRLAPAGQTRYPLKPRGPKRPAGPTVASRRP